jgi:cellulose synthase/poly-beta-1,6-N-acetylglucosamine synthase-like glycosyltransferase
VADGHVHEVKTPRKLLVNLQIVEYLRAFLLGRTGWSKLRALLIISGAFGLFRRELVIAAGGYDRSALGEDADLVVRLHRLCRARDIAYRIGFIADPVCWTEAPDSFSVLARQRERWHRGLMQVLWRHRGMIGRPRYGAVGLIAFPYFVIFEALGPLVEVLGYLCFALSLGLGWASATSAAAFFCVAIALGTAFSLGSLLVEERAFQRYRGWRCFARLIFAAILENVFYRQWYAVVRVWACVAMVLGQPLAWGEMTRAGFGQSQVAVPIQVPAVPVPSVPPNEP